MQITKYFVLMLVLFVLLVGCSKGPQAESKSSTVVADSLVKVAEIIEEQQNVVDELQPIKKVELPPAPVESKIVVEKSRQFSPELRDLLQKADSEIKSVSYVYAESPENAGFDTYWIKGNKMKILLFEKNDYVVEDYFNVVYLDAEKKTAKGKCENRKRCFTRVLDNTKRVYDLSYDDYRKKTAYEWVKDIEFAEIVGEETINNHAVTKIQSYKNDALTEMWIDTIFGLPVRIKVTSSDGTEKTYSFKNMLFNTLKDSDVVLQN